MAMAAEVVNDESDEFQDSMHGMYLTFDIATEGYGLEIRNVTEIIAFQTITNVPDMPEHVIGVLNLRGKVIPVVDVRRRFHLAHRDYDDRTCIIVVSINESVMGLVVDKVSEVVDIASSNIEPLPSIGKESGRYIDGLGKIDQQVKILLNVKKLIEDEDFNTPHLDS